MSHELRTPLNAVLGFAQLLLADGHADDVAAKTRRQRTEYIRDAGEHLMRLINDVLELSAFQGGEARIDLRVVALETLVSETLPLLGPLQAAHQISIEVGPMTEHVLADPMRLRQVLLNLLTNAVKYNRMGGSVRVDAQRRDDSVLLRVTDTGYGMSPDQMQELFEPFNRLGADCGNIEGTGIGLSIVKALMERMGGSVQVDSRIGEGSVFELRLAGATPANGVADGLEMDAGLHEAGIHGGPESGLGPRVASPAAQQPGRPGLEVPVDQVNSILYIEDNPVNAIIVSEMLARRKDIVLHLASDGGSGLALARSTRPQLILLDMQLPDFDGFEVLCRLKADPATAAIRCIALSANAVPEDIARALSAGVSDYWTKPLDLGVFMAALDRLFGKLS
jgi:CheY-like chemotaxis protein/anti-sigma regulatory factor (Ser/Thr protein kinase)